MANNAKRRIELFCLQWSIRLRSYWDSNRLREFFHWSTQLVFVGVAVYQSVYIPSPGKPVLVLTIAAVVMTLADMRPTHKLVWLLIVVAFAIVENRALDKDRDDFSQEQSSIRVREQKNFERILDENQKTFSATMGGLKVVTDQNVEIAQLTKRNLENITGGDSYAYLAPQGWGPTIGFVVWNKGKSILNGVTVSIARLNDPNWGDQFFKAYSVGTIAPGTFAPLEVALTPKLNAEGFDSYWIFVSAQNGRVSQMLQFKAGVIENHAVEYRFHISRDTTLARAMGTIPKGATVSKVIMKREWSDEIIKQQQQKKR